LYVKVSDTVKENSFSNILDIGFGNGYLEKRLTKQTAGVPAKGRRAKPRQTDLQQGQRGKVICPS
jgi:2-polyprenyl-3-methyl-5-hydroxy-6-metoxy-1,4-benzoquinol methylase